jgi:3-phenylpropionate/trans-cinnamate dioxygenase ferredoxin subunit
MALGRATAIGPGEHGVYQTPRGSIIVVNLDHEFYALEDICTHDGGILSDGWIEKDALVCPRHGAHFSIKTGEALCAPAYEGVNTYPVKIVDGQLFLKIS